MTDTILEALGALAYSLGDGNLEIRRNECSEWWVSLHWNDNCRPDYKPDITDAILDAVNRAALADEKINFQLYDDQEAVKTKLKETQERFDMALKQLGVR
jgi:hypothetical protein